jgi:hypothetical protein
LEAAASPTFTLCDGTSWSPTTADKKLHKLFHSTITLRNKVPNGYGKCGTGTESYKCHDED